MRSGQPGQRGREVRDMTDAAPGLHHARPCGRVGAPGGPGQVSLELPRPGAAKVTDYGQPRGNLAKDGHRVRRQSGSR
jgi:hypothetical protein